MFFIIDLEKTVLLEPRFYCPDIDRILEEKICNEMEGTCSGSYGFVLCIFDVTHKTSGRLRVQTGMASFVMSFKAVVFRPFKGEVMDAIVSDVTKVSLTYYFNHTYIIFVDGILCSSWTTKDFCFESSKFTLVCILRNIHLN